MKQEQDKHSPKIQLTPSRGDIRPRAYFNLPKTVNQDINQHHNEHHKYEDMMVQQIYSEDQNPKEKFLFGTNIVVAKVLDNIANFIKTFEEYDAQTQSTTFTYKERLDDVDNDLVENNLFLIDGRHVKEYDMELYYQLIFNPAQMITLFDEALKILYQEMYITGIEDAYGEIEPQVLQNKQHKKQKLMVSITHLTDVIYMRNLSDKYLNRLISFRGIVIRCSDIYPEMKKALFRCVNLRCRNQVQVPLENVKVQQPKQCSRCLAKDSFQLIHNLCEFTDKQYIKFQQLPQYVPQGQTPSSMTIVCFDSNVNGMKPGDRVEVVGIYRCQQRKVTRNRNDIHTLYSTYTDMISFRILEQNRFKACTGQKTIFQAEEIQEFHRISSSPTIIDDLVQSFASSIFGHTNAKKGLLAQIFGGTNKEFNGRGRFRSDINICLVGDPSTAKSQLLKQVHNVAPRGIYTSGKGSSAVGLTANVRKDPQTKQFILQSGALVLSDLGICCIDQFDKMDDNSKLILLQVMEQQTISVAKAGIVCQLNSRTSILSAANPIKSKYEPKKSVVQNINLPPALLSRFDLIYIILDVADQALDQKLAHHILSIYSGKSQNKVQKNKIPRNIFSKYVTYAKEYVQPQITDKSGKALSKCYLEMRKVGDVGKGKTVSATPRQLQSLIRISEAFAKMRLSRQVTTEDVYMAHDLIKDALLQSALDSTTGLIDMDMLMTGRTSSSRKRVQAIIQMLQNEYKANLSDYIGKKISYTKIVELINQKWVISKQNQLRPTQEDVLEALKKMQTTGKINLFGNDRKRPMFKFLNSENYS